MIEGYIHGVSIFGPGLEGWEASRPTLTGRQDYVPLDARPPAPSIMSANERRRTGTAVRLALTVAQEANEMAGWAPGSIASVFATANGDGAVLHTILESLTTDSAVSPTQFHNSVHNAAAGYWSIATGSQQAASCLAGHDATPAAALLKAMAAMNAEQRPILLCVYEVPMPSPLNAKRPTCGVFGTGLVLAPDPGEAALAWLAVDYQAEPAYVEMPSVAALHPLALGNSAARLLPVLEALARNVSATHFLPLLDGRLQIRIRSWSSASESSN